MYDIIGMLCLGLMLFLHFGQNERFGDMSDIFSGNLYISIFKNEPTTAPTIKTNIISKSTVSPMTIVKL